MMMKILNIGNYTKNFHMISLLHVFTMTGVLLPHLNISVVGKLENFIPAWNDISESYGFHGPDNLWPWNKSLGSHDSSRDQYGINQLFSTLFKDKRYIRLFCRLLYVDFVCFNYSLPVECSDMKH